MNRLHNVVCANAQDLFIAGLVVGVSDRASVEPAVTGEAASAQLERVLSHVAAGRGISHAVIAVERGDRSFSWIKAADQAGPANAPMRPDAPFFAASVTKLYTATVVLKLRERGALGLR